MNAQSNGKVWFTTKETQGLPNFPMSARWLEEQRYRKKKGLDFDGPLWSEIGGRVFYHRDQIEAFCLKKTRN